VSAVPLTDTARDRDRALKGIQALAAEIRAHEERTQRPVAVTRRPADEHLYRRLREVNGSRVDPGGKSTSG